VNSAFLVFDLIAGNACLEVKGNLEILSVKNAITVKRRSGLSAEKRVNRVPAVNASLNSTGRIGSLFAPASVNGYTALHVFEVRFHWPRGRRFLTTA
jgi:hypothetical protein